VNAPLFQARDLRVLREGRLILDLPALTIPDGQLTLLLGANGAGKTTLLLALAQLLALDHGEIRFLGQEVGGHDLSPAQLRRQVTLVTQDPYLLSGSVLKNIGYGLGLRGLDKAQRLERATEALAAVGLEGFLGRRARELSGGERQRVALARALALKPRALLLDEPFSNLDAAGNRVVEDLIAALPSQGCPVLLVTHDQAMLRRLSGQVLRLQAGRLLEPGQDP
jgi:tungstate transport system ATP-binding protein